MVNNLILLTRWNIICSRGASQIVFGSFKTIYNSKSKAKNAAVELMGKVDGRQRDDTWDGMYKSQD